MTIHKKLLVKLILLNQMCWFWYYYSEKKMLYIQQGEKGITGYQSKVLKKKKIKSTVLCVVVFLGGHLVYNNLPNMKTNAFQL